MRSAPVIDVSVIGILPCRDDPAYRTQIAPGNVTKDVGGSEIDVVGPVLPDAFATRSG